MGNDRKTWKRKIAALLAASLCAGALPAAGAAAEEDGGMAMGRYVETELALPENATIRDIVRRDDGTLRIIGSFYEEEESGEVRESYRMWDSSDRGDTWEETAVLPEEYENGYFVTLALARDGGGAGVLMEDDGSGDYDYSLVTFDAQGNAQEADLDGEMITQLTIADNGGLVGWAAGSRAVLLELSDGVQLQTLTDGDARIVASAGGEALALGNGTLQRYDAATGEPIARDEVLEEALFADGASYEVTTGSSYPIVFASDEEGRLFYCTSKGIYSHVMEGGVVEQVVNGDLSTLADPSVQPAAMETKDQSFYVLYPRESGAYGSLYGLLRFDYNPDMAAAPEKEITVYSLKENADVQQAAAQYQKLHPDTYVNYQIGMTGTDGVTVSDALRTLNTDILAGNGPDVLVLDGMNIETYAQKGLLADLSGIADELGSGDGLVDAVACAYRTEELLPAIVTKFSIPVVAGEAELFGQTKDFAGLAGLAAQTGTFTASDIAMLPEILYPICAGSWKKEDGTISQEGLMEYMEGLRKITDAFKENMSEDDQEFYDLAAEYGDAFLEEIMAATGGSGMSLGVYGMDFAAENLRLALGVINGMYTWSDLTSANRVTGKCQAEPAGLQQEQVFVPVSVVGVTSASKTPEEALEFVRYMLSQDGQLADTRNGFPVNRAALERRLQEPLFKDGELSSYSEDKRTGETMELTCYWPTQEEQDLLAGWIEELSVCADMDEVQRSVVLEQAHQCVNGNISAEEAVNTIMQKINLYLAE